MLHAGTTYADSVEPHDDGSITVEDRKAVRESVGRFASPAELPEVLNYYARTRGVSGDRTLEIRDAATERLLGEIALGILFLDDERLRESVLDLLTVAGIAVMQPTVPLRTLDTYNEPAQAVPNLRTYWLPEGFDFRVTDPDGWDRQIWIAQYNPTTKVLFVEERALVGPAVTYAARLGLQVIDVRLPDVPWHLEDEVNYRERRALGLKRRASEDPSALLRVHRQRLPEEVRHVASARWETTPRDIDVIDRDREWFMRCEQHVSVRTALFGTHTVTSILTVCRLCGLGAAKIHAPIATAPLSYCQSCLEGAANGDLDVSRGSATKALAEIGRIEFSGAPFLESQLDALQLSHDRPAPADLIDQLLLLRMALPRGQWSWREMLIDSGLAPHGIPTGRGLVIAGADGCLCLSMQEKAVDDFLYANYIGHTREPLYPQDDDYNSHGLRRADWRLVDGTLVEMWGMVGQPAYDAKMAEKKQLAERFGLRLIELTARDIPRLPQIFAEYVTGKTRPVVGGPALTRATFPRPRP